MNKKNKLWTIIGVSALVVVLVAAALIGRFAPAADPHAGHDHANDGQTNVTDEHGHDAGVHDQETSANDGGTKSTTAHIHSDAKIVYTPEEKSDGTYAFTLKDKDGKVLFSKDGLDRYPLQEAVSTDVYRLGWPTGTGPNDFQEIYCNRETGQISEVFDGAVASDGVRIALPIGDGKKGYSILVRNVFDKGFAKEYKLEDAVMGGKYAVTAGKLMDKGHVKVTYLTDNKGGYKAIDIDLYAE